MPCIFGVEMDGDLRAPSPRVHQTERRWRSRATFRQLSGCTVSLALFALSLAGCDKVAGGKAGSIPSGPVTHDAAASPVRYGYDVVKAWPHDPRAFTQGLVFRNGALLESTGLNGRSTLREVELATGRVLKQISVREEYFAEGLAELGGRLFQLTWKHQKGFVYDADTFRLEREFSFEGEGWGLATDGHSLILSDGTDRIRFLDPASLQVSRTIAVTEGGKPMPHLNELEWIRGEIFANVWLTDRVVRIDPTTGRVTGWIDFSGLLPPQARNPETGVLNGIAYDAGHDRLFVTGKCWPTIFEVRLKPMP
ncbi:MAG: glutaminyl-peptide cyclotransferase [Opitutaceae bacterium]